MQFSSGVAYDLYIFYVRITTISGSLIVIRECKMTAYTFCIGSMIRGMFKATMSTNLYEILWQMETYFVSEKWEIHAIHKLWLSRGNQWYPRCMLFGTCLDGENLMNFWSLVNFAKF